MPGWEIGAGHWTSWGRPGGLGTGPADLGVESVLCNIARGVKEQRVSQSTEQARCPELYQHGGQSLCPVHGKTEI